MVSGNLHQHSIEREGAHGEEVQFLSNDMVRSDINSSRRNFLKASAEVFVASSLLQFVGCKEDSKSSQTRTSPKQQRERPASIQLRKFKDDVEERDLGTVTIANASGKKQYRDAAVISFHHIDPHSGETTADNQVELLHREFLMAMALVDRGCKSLAIEKYFYGDKIPGLHIYLRRQTRGDDTVKIIFPDEAKPPDSREWRKARTEEVRNLLSDQNNFKTIVQMMIDDHGDEEMGRIIAASCPPDVRVTGLESKEHFDTIENHREEEEKIHQLLDSFIAALQESGGTAAPEVTPDKTRLTGMLLVGKKRFSMAELKEVLRYHAEGLDMKGPKQQLREREILKLPVEGFILGEGHIHTLGAEGRQLPRNLYLARAKGSEAHRATVKESQEQARNFLRVIEGIEKRNSHK